MFLFYSFRTEMILKYATNALLSFYLFIYLFWLRWVFIATRRLSLTVASRGYLLQCAGFSSCGSWVQQLWLAGSRAQAQ